MKILIVNIVYPTPSQPEIVGGAEVSVKALAEAFASRGHTVAVVRGRAPQIKEDYQEVVDGIMVYSVGIKNYYWPFDSSDRGNTKKAIWHGIENIGISPPGIGRIIDDFLPDVIHTNNLVGLTVGVWRVASKKNIPIMHVLRDYYLMCSRSTRFRNGKICSGTCAECYITTGNRSRMTTLVGAVSGNSGVILDTHLSAGLFSRANIKVTIGNIAEAKEHAGVARNKVITFGFIGRVTVEKGLEVLASAFSKIAGNCELVVAGEVPEDKKKSLEELASRPIRFLGFVTPEEFYSQVDVVVVPSLWAEPLPRSVLEAYSYGLPVIGSNRGGIPEAVGREGAGWIFDPDEDNSLVEIMQTLADRRDMIVNASRHARERAGSFSKNHIGDQHLAVLERLIGNREI